MTVNIALFDDLDAVAADADGALGRAHDDHDRLRQQSLFTGLAWYRLLQRHCPPAGSLLVARAQTEMHKFGRTRAWLFLVIEDRAARSFANYYSLRAGLSHSGADQADTPDCVEAIARALREAGLRRVEIGPDPAGFQQENVRDFRRAGWIVWLKPDKANWRTYVGGKDFAAYWEGRPARLKNTFKRRAKTAGLEIEIHDRFSANAWADYEAVYRSSWKPEEGSFPFLRALAEQESEAGTLRLGIAKKDGEPVAAQLWFVEHGEATIYKLAYAEASKALSPGTILGEAMFRRAIDGDRVLWIDYGVGDESYKADWMTDRGMLWRLEAYNPRTLRGLAGAARATASALVRRVRSR